MNVTLSLSGVEVALSGVPASCSVSFHERWSAFLGDDAEDPWLRLQVRVEGAEVQTATFDAENLDIRVTGDTARITTPEGRMRVTREGRGQVVLAPSTPAVEFYTLINLLLVGLAWVGPPRGLVLLHAAGVVLAERAFLLVGPAGSGKSTWTELAAGRGARVLGDDLVFVQTGPEAAIALGVPFRQEDQVGPASPGRWPVAALLLPVHGSEAAIAPVKPLMARARVLANMPFVAPFVGEDDTVQGVADRLLARVPCHELAFALDGSFVDLLEALPPP